MTAAINLFNTSDPSQAEIILADLWAKSARNEGHMPVHHVSKSNGKRSNTIVLLLSLMSDGKPRLLANIADALNFPRKGTVSDVISRAMIAGYLEYTAGASRKRVYTITAKGRDAAAKRMAMSS